MMIDADADAEAVLAFSVSLEVGEDRIGRIRLRPSRGSALPLGLTFLRRIQGILGEVEERTARGELDLVVFETTAPHPALTGYDLEDIRFAREDEVVAWSREAQAILRRVERLEVPSVAAIRSEWYGGAAELALACSYRVASDSPETRISFPQTRQGFLPAWGGTVRLPRLIGLREAMRLIVAGPILSGAEAVSMGLVDEVFVELEFESGLGEFVRGRSGTRRPRPPGRRSLRRRLFDETAPGRRLLSARASRLYVEEASSNIAARIALDLITETSALPLGPAFERECAAAGELIVSAEAQGRLHSERLTDRAARRSPMGRAEFESAAVLRGGEVGSDFAHLLVSAGTPVRIKDSRGTALDAVGRVRSRIAWEHRQGRISEPQAQRRASLVAGVTGFGGFGLLDVVVAAPDGTDQATLDLLLQVEPHIRDDCLMISHEWTLSPTALQPDLKRPERLVGMYPSLPIDRFPLVEIAPGMLTSPETVSEARRLAQRLALTGVMVSDHTPTPATRLIGIYLSEAARLLEEGVGVEQVDEAATAFGFDLGPFHRIDAIGSRRTHRMLRSLASSLGERMSPSAMVVQAAEHDATFYRYRGGRPTGPNPRLARADAAAIDDGELMIRQRLLLMLINEAAIILEEGCVSDPGDLEVISILGLGFPRERGGLLFYAQEVGIGPLVDDLARAAESIGTRFAPAGLLRDLAATGRGFFGTIP